jgi:hypothetical protein
VVRALSRWYARSAQWLADSAVVAGTGFRANDWLTFLVERHFGPGAAQSGAVGGQFVHGQDEHLERADILAALEFAAAAVQERELPLAQPA